MALSEKIVKELIRQAIVARGRAYAPYSDFPVGAAFLFENGEISLGCNVENGSFGGTICAERVALPSGIAAGYGKPVAAAVISKLDIPVTPCGICRQFMIEFNPEMDIYCCTSNGEEYKHYLLKDLLPAGFDGSDLKTS